MFNLVIINKCIFSWQITSHRKVLVQTFPIYEDICGSHSWRQRNMNMKKCNKYQDFCLTLKTEWTSSNPTQKFTFTGHSEYFAFTCLVVLLFAQQYSVYNLFICPWDSFDFTRKHVSSLYMKRNWEHHSVNKCPHVFN